MRWVIGDGSCVRLWDDIWIGKMPLLISENENITYTNKNWHVHNLISNGTWNTTLIQSIFSPSIAQQIPNILLPEYGHTPDQLI